MLTIVEAEVQMIHHFRWKYLHIVNQELNKENITYEVMKCLDDTQR